jgi:CDP-diacylglycerol--glycerol-3-phosphate 3-phosphatidyltransferase
MTRQKQKSGRILPGQLITLTLDSLDGLASFLIKLKFKPNAITGFALIMGIGAGLSFAFDQIILAIAFIVLCGLFDALDGKVAVQTDQVSLFGSILDSTLDRYSEFFIYLGLAYYFRGHWTVWIIFFTLLGSTMVSYTRAKAEALGIDCKIGIMQRAERMILIALGALIGLLFNLFDPSMITALSLVAIISNVTAIQRTFHVKKIEAQMNSKE